MRLSHLALVVTLLSASAPLARAGREGEIRTERARGPGVRERIGEKLGAAKDRLLGRGEHKFAPFKAGQTREWETTTSAGTSHHSDRVARVEHSGGRTRAELQTRFGEGASAQVSSTVMELSREGIHLPESSHLGDGPAVKIKSEGIALPRDLKVGKTWGWKQSWSVAGADVSTSARGRVLRNVKERGPDGKLHKGVEVELKIDSRTRINGQDHPTQVTQRMTLLEGIGMVRNSSLTSTGERVEQRLIRYGQR